MLLDSNVIIYAAKPEHHEIRFFLDGEPLYVSAISVVEVLGYHLIKPKDREYLERFFQTANLLPISEPVIRKAVDLRQSRRMTLGDALIAGSALVHKERLVSRNVKDFDWIADLIVVNPFEATSADNVEDDTTT